MERMRIAAMVILAMLAGSGRLAAQDFRGFAGGGVMSDLNGEHVPAFGGGVMVDLGQPWVSGGGQGEAFVSWPYIAGRGALFLQGNVIPRGVVRPLLLAGTGFGETAGPMFGAGVEIGPRSRPGIAMRLTVEDYIARVGGIDCDRLGYSAATCSGFPHGGRPYSAHQVTIRVAAVFR